MIEKKELLQQLGEILAIEEQVLALCTRQLGNAAFFSGIPPQNRPDVQAGLEAFQARSQQHRQTLENMIAGIVSGGRDVY